MAAFPVPEYLAGTAAGEPAVRDWLGALPRVVADLAERKPGRGRRHARGQGGPARLPAVAARRR